MTTSNAVFAKYEVSIAIELADFIALGSEETWRGWKVEENPNCSAAR